MTDIAYFRVSTFDQSIDSQRHTLAKTFDKEFIDDGVSGATIAANRPAFRQMLDYMRAGDTVFVTAIDRLGRDSIDVQTTYRDHFKAKGVRLFVAGLGLVEGETGDLILTLFAQFAQMERNRILARTSAGKALAAETLARTGKTHRGKTALGRSPTVDPTVIKAWRKDNQASIAQTAKHFDVSASTVARACRR